MEGKVVKVFTCDFSHSCCPAAVAPSNQFDRGIGPFHGLGKFDGFSCGSLQIKATSVIRSFIADLPIRTPKGCSNP